jgi:hypothetical protein
VPGWAQANPDGYVLIDDTPVPGYVALPAMIGPAARVCFPAVAAGKQGADHGEWEGSGPRAVPLDGPAAADGLAGQPVPDG